MASKPRKECLFIMFRDNDGITQSQTEGVSPKIPFVIISAGAGCDEAYLEGVTVYLTGLDSQLGVPFQGGWVIPQTLVIAYDEPEPIKVAVEEVAPRPAPAPAPAPPKAASDGDAPRIAPRPTQPTAPRGPRPGRSGAAT